MAAVKNIRLLLFILMLSVHGVGCAAESMPDSVRAIHFVSKDVSPTRMEELIDSAADHRFNVVIIGFAWRGSTSLESMPWIDSEAADWSPQEIIRITEYAANRDIVIVPNIPLLTHQHLLLADEFPELLYNASTYDPNNSQVYEVVFPIIEELINLTGAPAFHIGHDEVFGSPNRPAMWNTGEQLLPASLYLDDVVRLNDFLNERFISTWMWGDMLVGESEFPQMENVSLLGDVPGYGVELRRRIPKNVVVVDWHYYESSARFPTIDAYVDDELKVLGSTWKNKKNISKFSRYASEKGAIGMVATTWTDVWSRNNDQLLDEIIVPSGEEFFQWFPDEGTLIE